MRPGPMVATRCARLRRACDHHWTDGGDPLRPATPRLRSPLDRWWRPAAPGYAALAITTGPMVATRCARLRRACDHHWTDGGDPLRPATACSGDPLRPATPRLRSPRPRLRSPLAGFVDGRHQMQRAGPARGRGTERPVGVADHLLAGEVVADRSHHDPDPDRQQLAE